MPGRSLIMVPYNAAHPRVEAAFAAVHRAAFLGPGPWPICIRGGHVTTPDDDPIYLYQDLLVGLIPERRLNNGQPSGHAMLMARADPRPGEHVVHIGAGVGYYTAILAHMVGESGRVTAIEYDPGLAGRLVANFVGQANVRTVHGDGTKIDFDPADVIYVNAGVTRPVDLWLDRLKDGGRMILALTRARMRAARGSSSSDAATGSSPSGFPRPISSRARARAMPSPSGRSLRRSRKAAGKG